MKIPLGTQFRYSLSSIDIEPVRYVACAKYAIPWTVVYKAPDLTVKVFGLRTNIALILSIASDGV